MGNHKGLEATCRTIYCLPRSVQCVQLMDTGAEPTLIYSNPTHFTGPTACIEGYEGHYVMAQKAQVTVSIGHLPQHLCDVYASLVAKYILRVAILTGVLLTPCKENFGCEFAW